MGTRQRRGLVDFFSYFVLVTWALILAFPLYWVSVASVKNQMDFAVRATYLPFFDFMPSTHGWHYLFVERLDWFMKPFMNSVVISLTSEKLPLKMVYDQVCS